MRHDPDAKVLYRSKAFSQTRMPAGGDLCFTNLFLGEQTICTDGLEDGSGCYPAMFEVKQSKDNPARYAYCVDPLRRVFHAEVVTGHPILWS